MSPDIPAAAKSARKDEPQSPTSRKSAAARPQELALSCPRCDSPNTKFCYYNNYSLSQPRHFCKTCRRYWTKGGALRNVPIGGGCRKNKKMKSSPRLPCASKDANGSSSDIGGFKFFQGISPAIDFQLGGINFPRLHSYPNNTTVFNQFSSFGDISNTSCAIASSPCYSFDPSPINSSPPMGFSFPLSSTTKRGDQGNNTPGSLYFHSSLASSIESLSSINQFLHWKLLKQRLAMLFVEDNKTDMNNPVQFVEPIVQKPQPILLKLSRIYTEQYSVYGSFFVAFLV